MADQQRPPDESLGIPDHVLELILVRHAESTHNTASKVGRFLATETDVHVTGGLPDPLIGFTSNGSRQAKTLARVLLDQLPDLGEFGAFFDSGYQRTQAMLSVILDEYGIARSDERRQSHLDLRERDPGYTFTMTVAEVNRNFPWYPAYEAAVGPFYGRPPGGEALVDVCSRVHMFLNSLRRARSGARVFIVTHGRVLLAFRFWLEKFLPAEAMSLFDGTIANCEVLRYRREPAPEGGSRFTADEGFETTIWKTFSERCAAAEPPIAINERRPKSGGRLRTPTP